MPLREIVWDTETTGIDPKAGHRLVEIGAVEIIDKMPTGKVYHQYINPEREIEVEAIRVHGITNERVENEPTFEQIIDDFLEFIGDAPLVAHNAPFDMGFVNHQLELTGKPSLKNEVIDTLPMARQKFPGARATLDALCNRFEVDLSVRIYHGALLDAKLLADVYMHLCGGLQHGLSLSTKTEDHNAPKVTLTSTKGATRPARPFPVPEEELAQHQSFIKKIVPEGLWFSDQKSDA